MVHMGMAEGVSHLLDLLGRDASAVEFERPVVEARAAGLPAHDIETLERAKRVALALREQLEAHRRREAELAALFQTASDLAALTSVDEVLAAIVRRARALLGRDIAYLCLNDDDRGDTYMRVTDGSVSAEFQAVRLPLGAGLGGLVAQQGVPIASADYFRDERFPHTTTIDSAVRAEGLVSILGVPLKRGSQVIGVLFAADRRRAGLLPGRGRAAVLAGRACRGRPGQRPAAGRDPCCADRSRARQRRAARTAAGTSNWPCWPTTGWPNWCCAAAGSPRSPPNWPRCWAGRSSCRCRPQPDEPIGPGQSSVPVVRRLGGARPVGADPGRRAATGRSAGAGARRGGDRVAAAVQPASGRGGQSRPARPAGGPAHRIGHRSRRDRRQGSRSRCRPDRRPGLSWSAPRRGIGRTPNRRRRSTPASGAGCRRGSTATWCCLCPVTMPGPRPGRPPPGSAGCSADR